MQNRRGLLLVGIVASLCVGMASARAATDTKIAPNNFDTSARNLIGSFGHLNDLRDMDACAALFAEDGVLVIRDSEKKGRAEIKQWLLERAAKAPHPVIHFTGNIITTQEGPDHGHAISDVIVFEKSDDGVLGIYASVRYAVELVHKDGTWLIARLTVGA
jgi:hypothetical protein